MNRLLLRIIVTVGMCPATLLWCWGLLGINIFIRDAISGRPFGLYLMVSGASGIAAVAYLFRVASGKSIGNLVLSLSLLLPAWLAMILFIMQNPSEETIVISLGPIIVSALLLVFSWPRLTRTGKKSEDRWIK